MYRHIARVSYKMKPSSSCRGGDEDEVDVDLWQWAHNVRDPAKGLLLEVLGRLVLAVFPVYLDELEGHLGLIEDGPNAARACCGTVAVELENRHGWLDMT